MFPKCDRMVEWFERILTADKHLTVMFEQLLAHAPVRCRLLRAST